MSAPLLPPLRPADDNHRVYHRPPTIEKILAHIGEPTAPPPILPARGPPQAEFEFDQTAGTKGWPEIDQTTGHGGDSWD